MKQSDREYLEWLEKKDREYFGVGFGFSDRRDRIFNLNNPETVSIWERLLELELGKIS